MYDAIILAGGESSKAFGRDTSIYEAMIDINGEPMVLFVARALRQSSLVGKIYVTGPIKVLESCIFPDNTALIEGGRTIVETIKNGIINLEHNNKVLVVTADIPLITPKAIEDFINQCSEYEADLYYPIVEKKYNEARYPGNKRTYVRIKEGTFTGGNIFLVNPQIVPGCINASAPFIDNRKNPLKLCSILGWKFVVKFLLGVISLNELEQRVSDILKIRGRVILSEYPEIGMDVDKPSDLELVKKVMAVKEWA